MPPTYITVTLLPKLVVLLRTLLPLKLTVGRPLIVAEPELT